MQLLIYNEPTQENNPREDMEKTFRGTRLRNKPWSPEGPQIVRLQNVQYYKDSLNTIVTLNTIKTYYCRRVQTNKNGLCEQVGLS